MLGRAVNQRHPMLALLGVIGIQDQAAKDPTPHVSQPSQRSACRQDQPGHHDLPRVRPSVNPVD